ncbi:MAG: SpoIIE family protein phosphatase [Leptospiraceae bacterium]|nr:SpoIIE family protein phosphatase [Leptospiraceae bacterium]
MNQVAYFILYLFVLAALLLLFHIVRVRRYRGPYIMYIAFLWFLIYMTGHLGYKIDWHLGEAGTITIRYSSAVFTLIFAGLLLVYICEGISQTQNLIAVSIGSQLVIALMQIFLYYLSLPILSLENKLVARIIFEPSFSSLAVSTTAMVIDLFFAVFFFQLLVNHLRKIPLGILIFFALAGTMALDSVMFVAGTRLDTFWTTLTSHLVFKTLVVAVLSGPLALYIRWYQRKGGLDLDRGSLDIFKRIETLTEDLEKANRELREYADHLEDKVEERTREIKKKQAQLDLELKMAADLQQAMMPDSSHVRNLSPAVEYIPSSAVSGDLYYFGSVSEHGAYIFLGDISGHGVPSALVGAMCNMSLSRINLRKSGPASTLARISGEIEDVAGTHYLTAIFVYMHLKDRVLVFANGGHVPGLLLSPSGKILQLEPTGSILGAGLPPEFGQKRVNYKKNTRLVLFTDCVTEARNSNREEFGYQRFLQILQAERKSTPADCVAAVIKGVRDFAGTQNLDDDLTLIIADLP